MKWLLLIVLLFLVGCGRWESIPADKIEEYDRLCEHHSHAGHISRRGNTVELVCSDTTVIGL